MTSPEFLNISEIHVEFWITLYQIPSSHVDWWQNMAAMVRDYVALYGNSENLKNLLLRKCQADFPFFS